MAVAAGVSSAALGRLVRPAVGCAGMSDPPVPPGPSPILTAHLFPELDGRLLELLRTLSPEEWERPTIVPRWNVRQVASHLLDTALRRLSFARDAPAPDRAAPLSDRELGELVGRLNAQGVEVYGRLSPRVLIMLTEATLPALHAYLASLDPAAAAPFAVSWAGERTSPNWFDVARELTERWHHQQQIRLAVDRPGIMTPRLYGPVLDCFMRALPHAYRGTAAPDGAVVEVTIAGDSGGTWRLQRGPDGWGLLAGAAAGSGPVAARATLPETMAWRVFTRGIDPAEARRQVVLEGDTGLAAGVLGMTAIVT